MTENAIDLRTTTISLDEYNKLRDLNLQLKENIGAKDEQIRTLNGRISELKEEQPKVKVITGHRHTYHDDYDGNSYSEFREDKVEFVNLTEVERLAENKAKLEVKEKIEDLESKLETDKYLIKELRDNVDTVQDRVAIKEKQLKKERAQYNESIEEITETKTKEVEELKKAYKTDEKEYKETIKDLKEEIQKIKDNKTDAEIEEKRNKEIKDLKGRIKDLESMIEDLGKINFFKRVFKLRTISAEKLAAQVELAKRERAANTVGTTWILENKKYRKYNSFSELLNSMFRTTYNWF